MIFDMDEGRPAMGSCSGVPAIGLGDDKGALVMIDRGARMLNIWSSACGGPYESKGSGTDCSIGSMTGSELRGPKSEKSSSVCNR